MDLDRDGDPFLWDVQAVARYLGAPSSPWTRDPQALVARIGEEEIDGRTLLTYEHVCSRQELMECLAVKPARQKVALGEAIINLRARSGAFQEWKRDFLRKQAGLGEDVLACNETEKVATAIPAKAMEEHVSSEAKTLLSDQVKPAPPVSTTNSHNDRKRPATDDEESTKRKRIIPIQVAERPMIASNPFIPTEADVISQPSARYHQFDMAASPWENFSPGAYLGEYPLPLDSMMRPRDSLDPPYPEVGTDDFTIRPREKLPQGISLVIHRATRHLLIKNGRKEALQKAGYSVIRSPTPSDMDVVLELSDLPETFDEETLREIEDEKQQERERLERLKEEGHLTQDQIRTILEDAIADITSAWREMKLPKYQQKAYRLWNKAHRERTRKQQIMQAQQRAKFYDERLHKLCDGIMDLVLKKEDDVRSLSGSLEQTLEDKLYSTWLIGMLESRTAPPKPHMISRPKRPTRRQVDENQDDEVLTSSDEDDFIVPDENPEPMDTSEDLGPSLGLGLPPEVQLVKEESPAYVDLTGMETPKWTPLKTETRFTIDLTSPIVPLSIDQSLSVRGDDDGPQTPSSPLGLDASPSLDVIGDFGEVARLTPIHWVDNQDRWRLVVSLIWALSQARRTSLIEFIQEYPPRVAWEQSVALHLSNPLPHKTDLERQSQKAVAFDVTRMFWCFYKCKTASELRILKLSDRRKNALKNALPGWFAAFCSFIKKIAPGFPQDSQIYRADVFDEEVEEDVGDDESLMGSQGTPSKPRRSRKEIIRNKEAVALRERVSKRAHEDKVRKEKARADIAAEGTMSWDKTRLIVNESKDEHLSFIHINHDIGGRIKEHQIEGVRFMWNQIVQVDPDMRQGCLLAHTMGLGKTMQVITLLVTIAESAASDDPSVRQQIPKDMSKSQTLVLCPAGLVDNWMEELAIWTSSDVLGIHRKIGSAMPPDERVETVKRWAADGGVLVIGYTILSKLLNNNDRQVYKWLMKTPNIVVADEAHIMKNPDTKVHQACANFHTKARIALTGSPLANNVEEYRSMIDWVAPNFLGPLTEFREIYANPISRGLYNDSLAFEKRKALKVLEALKVTVAPKVHRATIKSCMKDDLPPKMEFVLAVPPTALQEKLYRLYVQGISAEVPILDDLDHPCSRNDSKMKIPHAQLFSILNHLALICNHPRCFRQKVQEVKGGIDSSDNVDEKQRASFPRHIIDQALRETDIPDLANPSFSRKVELLNVILDEARTRKEKVLVFSQSLMALDYLENLFKQTQRRVCRLDGKTQVAKRQEMIKDFNAGEQEVYLISTNAGGVGLNIQGANRVVIFDFKWNPVNDQQAIGRAYRIGQEKTVFVYRFVVAGTFEADLQNRHVFKTQLASRVVDKKNPLSWSKRQSELLHHIKRLPSADLKPFMGKDEILDKIIQYKTGEAIRSIVSTDTFEEEDIEGTLTADERQEVDTMVKLNNLRATDPGAWEAAMTASRAEELNRLSRPNQALPPPQAAGFGGGAPSHPFPRTAPQVFNAPVQASKSG